ncbi:MAG: nucleotidyltransferase family protein [Acidobacteriaceae bacterium]
MHDTQPEIALSGKELALVREILQTLLPEREVWAFGSRVHRRALKKYSDLDLAVMGDDPIPSKISSELRDAFDESLLAFKVDIVDWATTSDRFRKIIEQAKVVVQAARDSQSISESSSAASPRRSL